MTKELKTLEKLKEHLKYEWLDNFANTQYYAILKQALQRIESIDNANPSEELGLVKRTCEIYVDSLKQRDLIGYDIIEKQINEALDTIKQALLKAQENARSEEILQKYYQEGITLDSVRELKKENELLKEIIKSFFDRGCPLHQYIDKEGTLLIEVDADCSTMRLGEFKGVDLDKYLKEVLQ